MYINFTLSGCIWRGSEVGVGYREKRGDRWTSKYVSKRAYSRVGQLEIMVIADGTSNEPSLVGLRMRT